MSDRYDFVEHRAVHLIENYEEALKEDFKGWLIHHRLETHRCIDGKWVLRDVKNYMDADSLKKSRLYYNQPPNLLVWMRRGDHARLHAKFNEAFFRKEAYKKGGEKLSEYIKKNGHWCKGKPGWNKGKHLSEETKQKLSEKHKGRPGTFKGKHHTEETRKKLSESHKGNPGTFNGRKHTEEAKKKISESHKGLEPWNKITPTQEMIDDLSLGVTKWCKKYNHGTGIFQRLKKEYLK